MAAEIDRHAIGLLVIQGGEDALARGHGRHSPCTRFQADGRLDEGHYPAWFGRSQALRSGPISGRRRIDMPGSLRL